MHYSSRRPCAETLSPPFRDHIRPWPISAQKLVSLIDLGWSNYRIACHFFVEPEKVSQRSANDPQQIAGVRAPLLVSGQSGLCFQKRI